MKRGVQGSLRIQNTPPERFKAFVPMDLPPKPPLERSREYELVLSKADQMLGRLDGISRILPSVELLLYFYTRKEAILSSQIEGTQTTFSEYLFFEMDTERAENTDDIQEVSNYVAAMQHGLKRLREGFPLSLRLLREIHAELLRTGRGSEKGPGEFRDKQNWIGGSRPGNAYYVPPPPAEMLESLHSFETFLHNEANEFPVLVQAAMLHAQFETIHPFQDGNGRLGRLLMTLLLIERGVLAQPLLYLSLYLKQNRDEYFEHLQSVRMEGRWEEWIFFFLEAVARTAEKAVQLAHDILALVAKDRHTIGGAGKRAATGERVFEALQRSPYITAVQASRHTGLSFPTAMSALQALETMGVVREITGKARGKIYVYPEYVRLLSEGTDL
jgi:Fic family protein